MKEIKAYKTTDGTVHEDRIEALDFQAGLDTFRIVSDWVEQWAWSGMAKTDIMDCAAESLPLLLAALRDGKLL